MSTNGSESVERRSAHLPFLDHLRGVAILMVVVFHSIEASFGKADLGWSGWLRDFHVEPARLAVLPGMFGWFGVSVFFALSGFCIHLSHARSKLQSWQDFFIRRVFRIYPPYLLVLLVFSFWPERLDLHDRWDVFQFLSHALLIHNLDARSYFGINPSFWSVAVEFQLYLIYPLVLLIQRRQGWRTTLVLLAVVELGLRGTRGWLNLGGADLPTLLTGSPLYYGFSWSLGAAAADAYLSGRGSGLMRWPLWLWPPLALLCFCVRPLDPFCATVFAVGTVHLILRLLEKPQAPSTGLRLVLSRHLAFAGLVSYSLYLVNQPFVKLAGKLAASVFGPDRPLAVFGVCLAMWFPLLGLAWLVYQAVERPAIVCGKAAVAKLRKAAD